MGFVRCQTCGRYMQAAERYCSEQCAQRFQSCETCGRYFLQGQGYSQRFCSEDCAVQYKTIQPAYAHQWTAGTVAEGIL